jgi:hypothetical protein
MGDLVKIEMTSDKHYTDHDKHATEFPAESAGQTNKSLLSRLVFIMLYEHASK